MKTNGVNMNTSIWGLLILGLLSVDLQAQYPATFNLSGLNGVNGFSLDQAALGDHFGYTVSNAGDINHDGIDDIILGAHGSDVNASQDVGSAYVVFGQMGGFSDHFNVANLNGSNGFRINGDFQADKFGVSVSAAGDINHDGIDDLLIGAYQASPLNVKEGATYVIYGAAQAFPATLAVTDLNGDDGFKISGETWEGYAGIDVADAGDVNCDGVADLIIGAYGYGSQGWYSGSSYVVFGADSGFGSELLLSALNGSNGFQIDGEYEYDFSGYAVDGLGDFNGDGCDDLIIGAYGNDPHGPNSGAAYIVYGSDQGFGQNLALWQLTGGNGFKVVGINAGDELGFAVSAAGDVNGDGFDDALIGAPTTDHGGNAAGSAYVVLGANSGFSAQFSVNQLNGHNGFRMDGVGLLHRLGLTVGAAGDLNLDGVDDIIVGARHANGASGYGSAYAVFGSRQTFNPVLSLASLNGANGFVIKGANDHNAVSGAGDFNGDGKNDLLVGDHPGHSPGNQSAVHIIFNATGDLIFKHNFEDSAM